MIKIKIHGYANFKMNLCLFFTLLAFVKYLGNYYILQPWLFRFLYG